MRFVVDLLYLAAGLAFSPIMLYRMIRHRRYLRGWAQRFGKMPRAAEGRKSIWLHAVSVGEVNAAKTLVAELESRCGDLQIVVSTTTDTGYARANALFGPERTVVYFPFDLSSVMRRAFARIDPAICLLMELEVWPHFIFTAHRRQVPVVVINGRISDKSFSRYKRIKALTPAFFGKIDLVLAQTEQYAERFRTLGCPADRVVVTGSLKYDTAQITDRVEGTDALAEQLNLGDARLWVAGGTGNDEEKIVLDVYRRLIRQGPLADVRLAVVPRKPERFNEVAQLIERAGCPLVRYSELKGTTQRALENAGAVILGDTMGDLRTFYSLATVVFVGRSLVPMGGSDMMEAAALGKCTIFGPHTFNFRQTVEALLARHGAVQVADEEELFAAMRTCLLDADCAAQVARRGQEVIRRNQGATARTIRHITQFLDVQARDRSPERPAHSPMR